MQLRTGERKALIVVSALAVLTLVVTFGAISLYFPSANGEGLSNPNAPSGGKENGMTSGTTSSGETIMSRSSTGSGDFSLDSLPKSAMPSSNFYVTSTGGQGDPMSYTMSALAGIVARDRPQLFLIQSGGDDSWLSYIENSYGMRGTTISNNQALTRFSSYIQDSQGRIKVIEYNNNDAYFPLQLNVAATLAGVYGAIPVANTEISSIDSLFGGASNVNVEYNLTSMFTGTNESTAQLNAYNWLWNLTANQTTRAFFSMNPEGRPDLNDYVVEFKAFQFEFCCVNLSASNNTASPLTPAEMNFTTKVLSSYPPNAVDVGYIGLGAEVYTINIFSQMGVSEIADPELSDLSFYSGFPTLQNLNQATSTQREISYNSSEVYVMFEFTQGDALTFNAYANWNIYNSTDTATGLPYRDEIPVAWQINPMMASLAPPIMQDYYAEQQGSLDDFITGPSGGSGYNHPDQMGQYEAAQNSLTHSIAQNAGIGAYFVIFGGNPFSPSIDQTYIEQAQPKAVLLWQNSGHAPAMVDGVPFMTSTFWVQEGTSFTSADVSSTISTIQSYASSTHFVYVVMNAQNPGFPFISQVLSGLGSRYQPVNAEQFVSLFCQSQGQSCDARVAQ